MSRAKEQDVLYRRRARYYDAIYHWKDYAKESQRLRDLLHAQGVPDGATILEAACGTGNHLNHLKQWYAISGFDLSRPMIELAKQKLTGVDLFVADMCEFTIGRPVDALLCLFSSIGYVHPEDRLRAAAARFAHAVRPGGAMILEPWLPPEAYTTGYISMQTYDGDTLKLCRSMVAQQEGDLAVMEFHWLAVEAGAEEVEHFTDRHALWLCPRDTLVRAFVDAGFECRYESDGLMKDRGLVIGTRR